MGKITGTIHPDNPRYTDWVYIMGHDNPLVPLQSIFPLMSNFGEVYKLNMPEFTEEQRERLVERIHLNFKVPKEKIWDDIRKNDCVCKCDSVSFPGSMLF